MNKKRIIFIVAALFCILVGIYTLDFNRIATVKKIEPKPKQTSKDYMLSSLNVTSIAQDHNRLIWIGTSAGINLYNGKDYIQFFHDSKDSTALPDDYINALYCDKEGRMWVYTQNGVARYEGGYRFHRLNKTEKAPRLEKSIRGSDDAGTHGFGKSKTELPAEVLDALQKPKELISTVFKDAGGNYWIGFRNAGYQVVSNNLIAYKKANNNPLAKATEGKDITFLQTVGQHILAGTTLRLYVYDTQNQKYKDYYYKDLFQKDLSRKYPIREESSQKELVGIVPLDEHQAWLVGESDIVSCAIDGEHIRTIGRAYSYSLGSATRMNRQIYIAHSSHYLLRHSFGTDTCDSLSIPSRWYDNETQLTTLHDGNILLFMKNMHIGILSTKTGKMKELKLSGLPNYSNIDPAFARQDSKGNVWLGTKRYGLYKLDLKKDHVERMGFINDVHIQGLLEDSLGQIWITTLKDAICYQPTTGAVLMNSLVSSSQNGWNRQFFDNSICLSPLGDIVFGSSDGCISIPPTSGDKDLVSNKKIKNGETTSYDNSKSLEKGLCVYTIDIKNKDGNSLVINDSIKNHSHYTLAYNENDLTISFFYPNYSRRSSLMFQCKLEGYDKDWREPTYEHEAHFANLPSGDYTFKVRLVSSPNSPALAERDIRVTIKCAPWASAAAWLLYLSCIVFLLYFINSLYLRIRTNRMLLKQEQHEREREQRTNEMNMSFFANISHEFRNPITLIAGPLLSLKSNQSLPLPVQTTLDRVCLSVNRMLRLIDQMLDFNQLETDALRLRVSRVDVMKEIKEMASTFEESARVRNIQVKLEINKCEITNTERINDSTDTKCTDKAADTMNSVWIDSDKLEKIMSNLFTNALKHTPDRGEIHIKARLSSSTLEIAIYNSGSHIDEDKLTNVFKRYYQLADTPGSHHYGWGTGIGLYYVKRLVGLHHGNISVHNVDGGVEFCFALPVNKDTYRNSEMTDEAHHVMQIPINNTKAVNGDKSIISERHQNSESNCSTKRTKILIVDDDLDVAQYIRSIFVQDYIIENRYSAESALADMKEIAPDIILSDIIMGEMSGYDFCKAIKNNLLFSHIPVILITAKSNMNEQIDGLRLGAVAYVTKPFDPFYLKALVESQLSNLELLRKRLGESTDTKALTDIPEDALSEQDRKFMDELYALMEKRAAELDLNVATVCHDLLISQSKFNYKLKQLTGDTPGTFFRKYKLNKAAQLLKEGKYNASEIAVMVGFGTAAHFSVAFKKQFGVSPSDYFNTVRKRSDRDS